MDGGSDDVFERILARAAYKFSEKLDFECAWRCGIPAVGWDRRAIAVNPVFAAAVNYEPDAETRISLEGYRSVETSEFRPKKATSAPVSLAAFAVRFARASICASMPGIRSPTTPASRTNRVAGINIFSSAGDFCIIRRLGKCGPDLRISEKRFKSYYFEFR